MARGLRSKATMVEMVRKTPRATGADEPVLERAVHLTTEKKSSAAAKKPISGTNLDPIFAILQIGRAHV